MNPQAWSAWVYWLYAWAIYCAASLVIFWFRFHSLEKKALAGGKAEAARFNKALEGFPNAVLAKMFGKRPLE